MILHPTGSYKINSYLTLYYAKQLKALMIAGLFDQHKESELIRTAVETLIRTLPEAKRVEVENIIKNNPNILEL